MTNQIIGSVKTFHEDIDDWNTYEEILEQYFIVNAINDKRKSAFLISFIGTNAYKTLRDLCHPIAPKEKTFDELCELMRKQFSPHVAIFRERIIFYNAQQNHGESVTSWFAHVKKLSTNCKFGENLEEILLNKFITGMRPGKILDRLCEENETLKLQKAIDIAMNKEASSLNGTCEIQPIEDQSVITPSRTRPCENDGGARRKRTRLS